jgi:hypothetical protein
LQGENELPGSGDTTRRFAEDIEVEWNPELFYFRSGTMEELCPTASLSLSPLLQRLPLWP